MDLLNRALEQVIDQLVTQKISNLKLEIENQKQTILGMVLISGSYNYKMGRVVQTFSHFIFEINVGNRRIRHTTTLEFNDEFLDRVKID